MEDSSLFMQWAMNTLMHEHPVPAVDDSSVFQAEMPREAHTTNSWSSVSTNAGSGRQIPAPRAMDHDVFPPSPNSAWQAPTSSGGIILPVGWNFNAASAGPASRGTLVTASTAGLPETAYRSPPTRRPTFSAPYAHEHIMAERKRREKINQRFVDLSGVIPGLKKMDKATILSEATRYVKELQENLKAGEAAGSSDVRSSDTVVLVKRPCHAAPEAAVERKPLPEIEAHFSGKSVMVKVHCENGKRVVVRVLTEVEKLHLGIIDANVMSFPPCTLIITITAKVEEGFTATAEEIIGRLYSILHPNSQQHI